MKKIKIKLQATGFKPQAKIIFSREGAKAQNFMIPAVGWGERSEPQQIMDYLENTDVGVRFTHFNLRIIPKPTACPDIFNFNFFRALAP